MGSDTQRTCATTVSLGTFSSKWPASKRTVKPFCRASVTAWTSGDFNVACTESFWARAAAWSPDDSTVYVATTGFHVVGGSSQGARSGPCDAALAYPATHAPVGHKWINYTGCDSLYSVAADSHAAYTPAFDGKTDETLTEDQQYIGKCPAAMKPGDRLNPDGILWRHDR